MKLLHDSSSLDESCKGCKDLHEKIATMEKQKMRDNIKISAMLELLEGNCQEENRQNRAKELARIKNSLEKATKREFVLIQKNTTLLHEKNDLIEENNALIKRFTALLEEERNMKRLLEMDNAKIRAQNEASEKERIGREETKD